MQKPPNPPLNELPSRPRSGVPRVIVLHYSAGYNAEQCYDVLKGRGVSTHSAIERDGRIIPFLSEDRTGYHVLSGNRWGFVPDVNAASFGTELINFGPIQGAHLGPVGTIGVDQYDPADNTDGGALPEVDADPERVWYRMEKGYAYEGHMVRVLTRQPPVFAAFFGGYRSKWAGYPPAQMQGAVVWAHGLMVKYEILPEYVVGHEHVQANKKDPGPGFSWSGFWSSLRTNPPYPRAFDSEYRRPERIAALQSHLIRIGAGPGPVDGIWGNQTSKALDRAIKLWDALERPADAGNLPRLCRMLCRVSRGAIV